MIARIITILILMLTLNGCVSPRQISKNELIKTTRQWKEPKVAIWHYVGSKDGMDYFHFQDIGVHKIYSVESGQISLPHSFPLTKDQRTWIVMPWGPAAIR
jgi:hypothetical protein